MSNIPALPMLFIILILALVLSIIFQFSRRRKIDKTCFSSRTKLPGKDVFKYRLYFFEVGLFVAFTISFLMIQWTVIRENEEIVEINDIASDLQCFQLVRSDFSLPQKDIRREIEKPKENIIINEILSHENPEFIDQQIDEPIFSISSDSNGEKVEIPPLPPVPEFAEPDVPVIIAEQMPRFPGCEEISLTDEERRLCSDRKLLQFLSKYIKYPNIAQENGIEGTAVVRFIVGKDGSIRQAEIVRNVAGGCGSEALRVINLMVEKNIKWTPGRQGGRPVAVQFNLPVKFQLQK